MSCKYVHLQLSTIRFYGGDADKKVVELMELFFYRGMVVRFISATWYIESL